VDELSLAVELSADSDDVMSDEVVSRYSTTAVDSAGSRSRPLTSSRDPDHGANQRLVLLTSADDDSDDGESYARSPVICMHNESVLATVSTFEVKANFYLFEHF